ncbi:MAG: CAP domain-containing protein [Flavobacteriales bacterium]|nr:CAP domain-containing protein [Flavobacteriales bacterium]
MNASSVYKSIVTTFFLSISLIYNAGQPVLYKMGKYYFKKNKYDLSLWFMNQSRNKISREIRAEYYDILFEIYLKKQKNTIKESASNLSYANRYLKRAYKYKRYSDLEYNQKAKELYDSSLCNMISLINRGSKSRSAAKYFEASNNELSQFLLAAYNLEINDYKSEYIGLYSYTLKKLISAHNNKSLVLSENNRHKLDKLFEKQFMRLFKSNNYAVLKNYMHGELATNSFKKNIYAQSLSFQKSLSDTLSKVSSIELSLARDFYDKINVIDPSLVKESHAKNAFIHYHYANMYKSNDLGAKFKQQISTNGMPFNGDSIELVVPYGDYYKKKVFAFKDNLWADLFLSRSLDALEEGNIKDLKREMKNWNTILNYDSSFYKDQIKGICFDNFEAICDVIPELVSNDSWDAYYTEDFNNFIKLVDEIYEEKISIDVRSNNYETAVNRLLKVSYLNPHKKRAHHSLWFIPCFKKLLDSNKTKSMCNEMVLANHLYSENKKLMELRKQYLIKDYVFSHQSSSLTVEDVNWSGDLKHCNAGSLSEKYYDNMLERIKFFRRMTGISDDVTFKQEYNQQAQAAALIMNANSLLDHHPKKNYSCYSESGYKGASHGNLYAGRWSADCIDGYIADAGVSGVGHRRWIINPFNTHFGTGSTCSESEYGFTDGYNCLVVITDENDYKSENFYKEFPITWPMQGYFPKEFLYNYPWSFSLVGADFSKVKILVKQDGVNKKVKKETLKLGYAQNTISWNINSELNLEKPIKVILLDVYKENGERVNFEYDVLPFSIQKENEYTNN